MLEEPAVGVHRILEALEELAVAALAALALQPEMERLEQQILVAAEVAQAT
jgi:hypothetical protein